MIIANKIDEETGSTDGKRKVTGDLARIIWNLVNLGYADTCFSPREKEIVAYLLKKWSVSKDIYLKFIDIADTILALEKHKAWIAETFPEGSERQRRQAETDSDIRQLSSAIEATIRELV